MTGGALVSAGAASLDGGDPGTPPVTLIESLSSLGADCAAGADGLSAWSERIELPTVPGFIAGTEDGAGIGVCTPS